MSIQDFLKGLNKKSKDYDKNNELFKIPKGDKEEDMPRIKNNISKPNFIHQGDIIYLPTSQFGYKYALVVVDIATSEMDAVAIKGKTQEEALSALKKIYEKNKILKKPLIIQFDSGSEFKNEIIKDYFNKDKISVRYTKPNRHRQNSTVEAKNKHLGTLILKFQAMKELETGKKSTAWHLYLKEFVKYMNTKKQTPKEINMLNDVAGRGDKSVPIEVLEFEQKVRKILDFPISAHNNKKIDNKFRTGDIRWSKDIYKVKHIILNPNMPPLYMLNKKDNEDEIDNTVAYTINQLLKVKD